MPAKKKSAAKKAAPKKSATKKAPAKKAAPKKSAAKAAKTSTSAKTTKKAAESKGGSGNDASRPKASDILKRTKHHTPTIFKVGTRKAAPVVFSLENVREILKRKAKEEAKAEKEEIARKTPAKKAAARPVAEVTNEPVAASKHGAASLADILGFGGGGIIGSPAPQRTVPRKWKKFYDLLVELRDHVKQSLGMHAEDTLKRSQKEDTGDLSTSADAGTDSFDRDFALSVVSSEQEALREIEAAINRVYNGTYGVCEITGEKISDERLEAVPFTRFSLEGQRQHELTARRRVSRTGAFLSEGADVVSFGDDDGDN